MKTEEEVNAYVEALDRKDEQLENEVVRHAQRTSSTPTQATSATAYSTSGSC